MQADALDFLSDAANYTISLFMVGTVLQYRAKASLLKGAAMAILAFGCLAARPGMSYFRTLPEAEGIGIVGALVLLSNAAVFGMLWAPELEQ